MELWAIPRHVFEEQDLGRYFEQRKRRGGMHELGAMASSTKKDANAKTETLYAHGRQREQIPQRQERRLRHEINRVMAQLDNDEQELGSQSQFDGQPKFSAAPSCVTSAW